MDVEPKYNKLGAIFPENRIYNVPKFQRAYSWQKTNVLQYLTDIKDVYFNSGEDGEAVEHFLGGIVCVKIQNENRFDERSVFELVDGQQRLSTTVLLISRLINYLQGLELNTEDSELRDRRISKYRNKFLVVKLEEEDKEISKPRLNMSRRDFDYYRKAVYENDFKNPTLKSHQLIESASKEIDKWIKDILKESQTAEKLSKADTLFKVISQAFNIIIIKMVDVSDAYKLFQVINDRGRSLTSGDLLRAGSLGIVDAIGATGDTIAELENIWDLITSGGAKSTDDRLIAYYTSKKAKACRKTSLFQTFNKEFFSEQSNVEASIRSIGKDLKVYDKLAQGIWPYENSTLSPYQKSKLKNLVVNFKHTVALPLLMSAVQLKEKKFYQLVFMLEKFFFLFRVALNKRMIAATKAYYSTIAKINEDPKNYQAVWFLEKLTNVIKNNVTPSEIDVYIDQLEYEIDGDNRAIKYIYMSFEENHKWLISGNKLYKYMYKHAFKGLDKSPELFSLEHIYPKTALEKDKDAYFETTKHTIANLTLLYAQDNSTFGNDAFVDKKGEYDASRLNITRELSILESWDETAYKKRDREIRGKFKKLFSFGEFVD